MMQLVLDGSKHATQLASLRTFAATVPEVLFHPRRFFTACLGPQEGAPADAALRPLPPFKHLGMGIALATLVAPLHQAMLRAGGFPDEIISLVNRSPAEMAASYGAATGRNVTLIDLSALTGVSVLDEPMQDLARTATYGLLAALFWLYSGGRLPVRKVMTYFAYAFGACLVVGAAANLLGDLLFLSLAGDWQSRSFAAGLVTDLAGLVRLGFILAVPALIFPALFAVSRGVVIRATALAVLTWGIGGLLVAQVMMATGLVILGPGL